MDIDLNMELGDENHNEAHAETSHIHDSAGISNAGNQNNEEHSEKETLDDSRGVGKETAATGATIEEPTGNTADLDADDLNDGTADAISTPQPPSTEMRFDSFESAKEHYREYAHRKGFGIRIDWSRSDDNDEYYKVYMCCTKAGKPYQKKEDTQNPSSVVKKRKRNIHPRTDCKAFMYLKKKEAWWHIASWSDEHNHPMIIKPSLTKFLRAHRNIPEDEIVFLRMLHSCNIPTCRQMQLMSKFYGKLEDVPYTHKDVANQRAKFRSEHTSHDMQDTLAYFDKMKTEDKDFFYRIKLDENLKVENIFWVDGASRRAYKAYSDCISFDTTYLTNRYKMPCAPFIGINNHGQSVQFGCGFLRNEVTSSFVWLFKVFLEAMDGIAPTNIITDQDFAMRAAISEVFKDTIHRNCRWHVVQNLTERMGTFLAKHPELHAAFNACVNNSLTPEEFDASWNEMLDVYGVRNNSDFHAIWEHRMCWVPAYFMHNFFPFLQTTARSEGFNAVLKRYVDPSNSIYNFVKQYALIQDKILNAENKAEADTALTDPDFWCRNPIEKQMSKAYTQNIFYRFQKELRETMSYNCQHLNGYRFELTIIDGPVPHYGYRNYTVFANWEEGAYSCNCCKFERDGMLCCHVLKVMTHIGIHEIPPTYILKRWGWDAEAALGEQDGTKNPDRNEMTEEARNMMVFASLRDDFRKVATVACKSNDGRRIVKTHLQAMKQELDVMRKREEKKVKDAKKAASNMPSSTAPHATVPPMTTGPSNMRHTASNITKVPVESTSGSHVSSTQCIGNPPRSTTKGRPQEIANKNPLDVATKKAKKCSFCKSTEHTIRKCAEKKRVQGLMPAVEK